MAYIFYIYTPSLALNVIGVICFIGLATVQFIRLIVSYRKYSKHIDQGITEQILMRMRNESRESMNYNAEEGRNYTNDGTYNRLTRKDVKKPMMGYIRCFIPMFIGYILEAVGYIARIGSHYDKTAKNNYILQSMFILLAPAFFAATIYMLFGRMVRLLRSAEYSFIPLKFLSPIFVTGDVISIFVQSSGGGLSASGNELGSKIILCGLFVQIITFSIFMILETRYVFMMTKNPTDTAIEMRYHPNKLNNWHHLNWIMIVSCILIMIRSIYKVIEYIQGNTGYFMRYEAYTFIFDCIPIIFCCSLYAIFAPVEVFYALTMYEHNVKNFP